MAATNEDVTKIDYTIIAIMNRRLDCISSDLHNTRQQVCACNLAITREQHAAGIQHPG